MGEIRPDPTVIMQMTTSYWPAATLLAANELNLFDALASEPLTAPAAAERLQADLRGVTMLLDACVGLGLLIKEAREGEAVYRNGPEATAFLVPDRPGYLGGAIRWSADQYAAWGSLASSVKTGQPVAPPLLHLGEDPEQTRRFVLGMHNRAQGVARGVLHFLDLSGVTHLLDVGGGPGTYAVLLAQKYPELNVTVLDLPAIAAIAQELLAETGIGDRVQMRPGNAVTDDYGTEAYNGVLFSGVLHQMSPATIRQMFVKAYGALQPGGRVIVSDMMLNPDKTQPAFSTLFTLQMLLTSQEGAVFSTEECKTWLEEAGFKSITAQNLPLPLPYTVVCGRKL